MATVPVPAPVYTPATVIPETTYNYYDATPPVTSPPAGYVYEDPYYAPDYYSSDYPYYGAWPLFGYVGVGVYGGGFYHGGYGDHWHGYRGGGDHGVEHPFYGNSRGGIFHGEVGHAGGFHGGVRGGGGFHAGGGGGFHGGGGHR
jgi:hypothetical protein